MIRRILALLLCVVMFALPLTRSVCEETEAASTPVVTDTPAPTPEPTPTAAPTPEPTPEAEPETPSPSETAPAVETVTPVPTEEAEASALPSDLPAETPTATPSVEPSQLPSTAILTADYANQAAVLVLGDQSLDLTGAYSYFLYSAPSTDEYTLTVDGTLAKEGYLFRDPGDGDPALAEAIASSRVSRALP